MGALRWGLLILVVCSGACSAVTEQYVTPDFDKAHKARVWRVHIQANGVPKEANKVGQLWTLVSQRWINHHRDYIAKARSVHVGVGDGACGVGINSVLSIKPMFTLNDGDVSVKAEAELKLCKGNVRVWTAKAEGSWSVDDDELKTTTAQYVKQLGASVRPWVPATFRLLRELLDTMPKPKLTDDDAIMEKIELED